MRGLSVTALYKHEPRLLSRSTTILKPSSKTCCSISSRIFEDDIAFCFSLFVVRLRDEAASVSTGGILIGDSSRDETRGQPGQRTLVLSADGVANVTMRTGACHSDPFRVASSQAENSEVFPVAKWVAVAVMEEPTATRATVV